MKRKMKRKMVIMRKASGADGDKNQVPEPREECKEIQCKDEW